MDLILRLIPGPDYTSKFYKSDINPDGIGSPQTISKIIRVLEKLNVIERYQDETRPRLYLRLTEKGRLVAEHLKAIEELLG
jgi:DNA-binding PadR family transcriptional regulator